MSNQPDVKGWNRLIDAAKKMTEHKLNDEIQKYPWRRPFNAMAPDVAKSSLKRDFEIGLVYPITDEISGARKACGLDPMPPTAHKFVEQAENKRKIVQDLNVPDKMTFDPKKRVFEY
jgi:heterodisulfide reductase subunit C